MTLLERANIIAKPWLREVVDLPWPRILTDFALMFKRIADHAVVGLSLGSPWPIFPLPTRTVWPVPALFNVALYLGLIRRIEEKVMIVMVVTLLLAVIWSHIGERFSAIREDEAVVANVRFNPAKYMILAFV